VINKLGERIVPAANGHVLGECREIGIGGLAIIEIGPKWSLGWVSRRLKSSSTISCALVFGKNDADGDRRWQASKVADLSSAVR
jgi:hypothetical protein